MVELPLFPLRTVLFPHMALRLRIFEKRYRTMMRDCEREGTTFGVVAIKEGAEVGGDAQPYPVGTLAHMRDVVRSPDGGYTLLVIGRSRFRIESLNRDRPYLVGAVHYLEDSPAAPDDAASLADKVRAAFRTYVVAQRDGDRSTAADIHLPMEPELLSYDVAASLGVETSERQRLLEIDDTTERLHACMALLRQETRLVVRTLAGKSERAGFFSLN